MPRSNIKTHQLCSQSQVLPTIEIIRINTSTLHYVSHMSSKIASERHQQLTHSQQCRSLRTVNHKCEIIQKRRLNHFSSLPKLIQGIPFPGSSANPLPRFHDLCWCRFDAMLSAMLFIRCTPPNTSLPSQHELYMCVNSCSCTHQGKPWQITWKLQEGPHGSLPCH